VEEEEEEEVEEEEKGRTKDDEEEAEEEAEDDDDDDDDDKEEEVHVGRVRVVALKTPLTWHKSHGVPHASQTAALPQWPAHARQEPAATAWSQHSHWRAMIRGAGVRCSAGGAERPVRRRK